jgi:hypothetical protein
MISARNRHLAGFERLAQRIEHLRLEFRKLVEKQHAMMRQRNLARQPARTFREHPELSLRPSGRFTALAASTTFHLTPCTPSGYRERGSWKNRICSAASVAWRS